MSFVNARHRAGALILALSLLGASQAMAQDRFPGIEKLMSEEEFSAAGLDKLTPEERAALNTWLVKYTAADSQILLNTNEEVKEAKEKHEIRASIVQPFTGWSGKTRFVLDNGQVWQQRLEGRYQYSGDNTEVVITKNFLGFYKMTLLATDKSVGVTRVE